MGKHLRAGTQECWDFTPDDTDVKLHISADMTTITLQEILDKAKEKWPGAKSDQINITPEKIHTRAIYYDRYDPSDWDNYIVLELKDNAAQRSQDISELSKQFGDARAKYIAACRANGMSDVEIARDVTVEYRDGGQHMRQLREAYDIK